MQRRVETKPRICLSVSLLLLSPLFYPLPDIVSRGANTKEGRAGDSVGGGGKGGGREVVVGDAREGKLRCLGVGLVPVESRGRGGGGGGGEGGDVDVDVDVDRGRYIGRKNPKGQSQLG